MNASTFIGHLVRDLRFGVRNLLRSPTSTVIAVASLALGIGGTAAMYSVIYGVVLDPFPYKDVDRLMSVQVLGPDGRSNGSYYPIDEFLDIAERNTVFQGVIASTWSDVTWTGDGEPQRLRGNHCTLNTFEVMGVQPLIGRTTTNTDAADTEAVAVLGYKFWQRQFGGDPAVIGRKLLLNGKVRTVIGVMPPRFMWRGADVYLPDVFHHGEDVEGEHEVHLLGRLKPGVSAAQAEAGLKPVIAYLVERYPNDFPRKWRVHLLTLPETFPSGIRNTLWILFGAVGLLLLISCVNVSNLLLSKMAYRSREIAIRASLGAGRARIMSQLLSESVVLGLAGGALGVVIAYAALNGIMSMAPPNTIPDEAHVAVNGPVLWFTFLVAVGSALLFGMAPALHSSNRDLVTPLKESGRAASGGGSQRVLSNALVVGEVALSLMLLVGASLMIRTLLSVQGVDLGMRPDRILTMRIPFSKERYQDLAKRNAFLQDVLHRLEDVPGVAAAGVNTGLPPVGNWLMPVEIAGRGGVDSGRVFLNQTSADYLRATGIPVLLGRFFSEQDVNAKMHSAVVNQAFVRHYFGSAQALGRSIRLPRLRSEPANLSDDSFQIVGIVKDTVNRIAPLETRPEVYIPFTLAGMADRVYILATARPVSIEKAARAAVYAADRGQPLTDVGTLASFLDQYVYAGPRFNLLLFAVFAGLGLTLAILGVYGVISGAVAQQTRAIGIRVALGASFPQIVSMVLGSGARLLGLGVAAGLVGSLLGVRVLAGLVANVSPFDPWSFIAVTLLLFAAGLFASFWPARRAARIDPMIALREE